MTTILGFEVRGKNGEIKPRCSLSDCAENWLGKPMSKEERLSNWAKIPLTPRQTNYTALDAWILIKLFDEIRNDPEYRNGIEHDIESAKFRSINVDNVTSRRNKKRKTIEKRH